MKKRDVQVILDTILENVIAIAKFDSFGKFLVLICHIGLAINNEDKEGNTFQLLLPRVQQRTLGTISRKSSVATHKRTNRAYLRTNRNNAAWNRTCGRILVENARKSIASVSLRLQERKKDELREICTVLHRHVNFVGLPAVGVVSKQSAFGSQGPGVMVHSLTSANI